MSIEKNYKEIEVKCCANCGHCKQYFFCMRNETVEVNPTGTCNYHVSKQSIKNLEEDIDAPILNCVKYLNLLGVETIWSCCGFDYHGQPSHKTHQYENSYITCVNTDFNRLWLNLIVDFDPIKEFNSWRIMEKNVQFCKPELVLMAPTTSKRGIENWQIKDSPHFHEIPNTHIKVLESSILRFANQFKDRCIIEDSNRKIKEVFPFWQYRERSNIVVTSPRILGV